MGNRKVSIILGIVLILIACVSLLVYQIEQKNKAKINQLTLIAEEAKQKAQTAEDERRAEEERRKQEEQRRLAEIERQKALSEERQLLEDQRRKEEEERKAEEEAQQKQIAKEEEARRLKLAQLEAKRKANTVSFQVKIDSSCTETQIAQVFEWDQVNLKIQRFGASEQLFAGLLPMEIHQQVLEAINGGNRREAERQAIERENRSRRIQRDPGGALGEMAGDLVGSLFGGSTTNNLNRGGRERPNYAAQRFNWIFATGPDGGQTLVTMPIKENDQLIISQQVNSLHPSGQQLRTNSQSGNILFIGTGLRRGGQTKGGYFIVDVEIYASNKWGTPARRLSK